MVIMGSGIACGRKDLTLNPLAHDFSHILRIFLVGVFVVHTL